MFTKIKKAKWKHNIHKYDYMQNPIENVYRLTGGSAQLSVIYESHDYDFVAETLYYGEEPYFSLFSPTGGFYETAIKWIRRLNKHDLPVDEIRVENLKTPEDVQESYYKILKHLRSGDYQFQKVKVEMTDGIGNLFWKSGNKERYDVSGWTPEFSLPKENFLYNTEHPSTVNWQQIDYYRDMLKNGSEVEPGLGIHVGNNIIFLLDGHHRALASLLEVKDYYVWVLKSLDANFRTLSREVVQNNYVLWKNIEKEFEEYQWTDEVLKKVYALPTQYMLASQNEMSAQIFGIWSKYIIENHYDLALQYFLEIKLESMEFKESVQILRYYTFRESPAIAQKYLQFMIEYPIGVDKTLAIYHEQMTAYLTRFPNLI